MPPTLADLHAAIVASPEDDAPRLAYADAIESQDPIRAQFIRLQIDLARCRRDNVPPPTPSSYMDEGNLIRTHGDSWAQDLQDLIPWRVYIRGFVEWVKFDAQHFLDIAPELYRRAPILHLELQNAKPVAEALFASPHLARIVSINLWKNDLEDAEAQIIARSPHLKRLAWLDLGNNKIGGAGFESLAASTSIPRLEYLGFTYNTLENPCPKFADDYDTTSLLATQLMAKYGHREWLDAHSRSIWPPHRHLV
ncbi:MAG TPA: TIGR02996 domain-containing protein [Bryobacteraceae bacterium]|jgi:uncharacterized protein (TIGR02996 family)